MTYQIKGVSLTERGWAGHYICSDECCFRRNTLLEYNGIQVVVSTVGNRQLKPTTVLGEIGISLVPGDNHYYETMAFLAEEDNGYIEANVGKAIDFSSNWYIDHIGNGSDNEANDMHDKVCLEIVDMLVNNSIEVNKNERLLWK